MADLQADGVGGSTKMQEGRGVGVRVDWEGQEEFGVEIKRLFEAQPLNPLKRLEFKPLLPRGLKQ